MDNKGAVFFDCWDTVIRFCVRDDDWNTRSLADHCVNHDMIDWKEVDAFAKGFVRKYYDSMLRYEITALQLLTLIVRKFSIQLDCPVETCTHDILSHLSPTPIPHIQEFLSYLDENGIEYAILSNTIYTEEDSKTVIDHLLPGNHFRYFFGSGAVGIKKPNPLFFQVGVSMMNKDISESIYIGDAFIQDVCGSYQAGFGKSIWLNHKKHKKEEYSGFDIGQNEVEMIEVSGYEELLQLMKEGNI